MTMKARILPRDAFAGLSEEWARLAAGAGGVPVLDVDFVAACLEHLASDEVNLAVIEQGSAVVAMSFLVTSRLGTLETWAPGQAPLGLFVVERPEYLPAVLEAIFKHYPTRAMLSVLQQDSRYTEPNSFGTLADEVAYIDTPWIECATGFDEYWESLGSNIKRNMRKDGNKLEARNITPRMSVVERPEDIAAAVAAYGELEMSGWKGAENSAVSADNAQGRFYTGLLERFSARGRGFAYQLFYGDRLVASDLAIAGADCVVILKTAYLDEERATSPAQMLRRSYFPLLIERYAGGRIEFYGRALDWHRRWTKLARPLYHVNVYRSGAARAVVRAARSVRHGATDAARTS